MDLEYFAQVSGRVCASSLLTAIFFGIVWIIVYSLEIAVLIKVIGYIALVWLLAFLLLCVAFGQIFFD